MANIEAGSSDLRASDASQVEFSFAVASVVVILIAGLALRLVLATFPGFGSDLGTFQAWSRDLAHRGPWEFYDSGSFSDWTPGYLYVLLFLGLLDRLFTFDTEQFEYVLKLPPIVFDLASVYLLYLLLEGQKPLVRLGGALLYALHPALLIIGPVWAQVDSAMAFFLLFTVYAIARGKLALACVVYTIGFLTKPQSVAALPVFTFWILRDQAMAAWDATAHLTRQSDRVGDTLRGLAGRLWQPVVAGLLTAWLVLLPFFPENPFRIFGQLSDATDVYPYSTFFAYNFWGVFWARSDSYPAFPCDSDQLSRIQCVGDWSYLGMDYRAWGIILFAVAMVAILLVFRRARGADMLALATALSVLAFFIFLTRMHERYMFAALLPLLAAAVLSRSWMVWGGFLLLSVIHFFNLYYVYAAYNPNELKVDWLFNWIGEKDKALWFSLLTVLSLPALLATAAFLDSRRRPEPLGA